MNENIEEDSAAAGAETAALALADEDTATVTGKDSGEKENAGYM
jgi:hypothetical protein